jgi:hypothetical protein
LSRGKLIGKECVLRNRNEKKERGGVSIYGKNIVRFHVRFFSVTERREERRAREEIERREREKRREERGERKGDKCFFMYLFARGHFVDKRHMFFGSGG